MLKESTKMKLRKPITKVMFSRTSTSTTCNMWKRRRKKKETITNITVQAVETLRKMELFLILQNSA